MKKGVQNEVMLTRFNPSHTEEGENENPLVEQQEPVLELKLLR